MPTISVEGFKDLDDALGDLSKVTAKNVGKRALIKAGQPTALRYAQLVHRRSGALAKSSTVTDKLSGRQKRLTRKESPVEVYIGPGPLAQAVTEEFGTPTVRPHPSLRPAWDETQDAVLAGIKIALTLEIDTATKRAKARALRKASK
jgi:hypothetical protein